MPDLPIDTWRGLRVELRGSKERGGRHIACGLNPMIRLRHFYLAWRSKMFNILAEDVESSSPTVGRLAPAWPLDRHLRGCRPAVAAALDPLYRPAPSPHAHATHSSARRCAQVLAASGVDELGRLAYDERVHVARAAGQRLHRVSAALRAGLAPCGRRMRPRRA